MRKEGRDKGKEGRSEETHYQMRKTQERIHRTVVVSSHTSCIRKRDPLLLTPPITSHNITDATFIYVLVYVCRGEGGTLVKLAGRWPAHTHCCCPSAR